MIINVVRLTRSASAPLTPISRRVQCLVVHTRLIIRRHCRFASQSAAPIPNDQRLALERIASVGGAIRGWRRGLRSASTDLEYLRDRSIDRSQ